MSLPAFCSTLNNSTSLFLPPTLVRLLATTISLLSQPPSSRCIRNMSGEETMTELELQSNQLRKEIAQEEERIRTCEAELANDHFLRRFLAAGGRPSHHPELQSALRRFTFTKANNPRPNHYVFSGFFPEYSVLLAEIDVADLGDNGRYALRCRLVWESTYFDWLNFETASTRTLQYALNVWIERVADYIDFDRQRRRLDVAYSQQVETQHEQAFTVIQIPIVPQKTPAEVSAAAAVAAVDPAATKAEEPSPEATDSLVVTWQFGGILRLAEAHPGLAQTDLDQLVETCKKDVEQTLDLLITQCTGSFKEERLDEKYRYSPTGRKRSDYEVLRCSRMERNETVLMQLGLGGATGEVIDPRTGTTADLSPAAIAEAAMQSAEGGKKKAAPKKPRTPKAKKPKAAGKKAPPRGAEDAKEGEAANGSEEAAAEATTAPAAPTVEPAAAEVPAVAPTDPVPDPLPEAATEEEEQKPSPSTKRSPPRKRAPKDPPTESAQPKTKKRATSPTEEEAKIAEKKDGRMNLRTSGRRLPKATSPDAMEVDDDAATGGAKEAAETTKESTPKRATRGSSKKTRGSSPTDTAAISLLKLADGSTPEGGEGEANKDSTADSKASPPRATRASRRGADKK